MADSRPHDGPSLVLLAAMCIALLFGGLAIGAALGGVMPLPYGPVAAIEQYVRTQPLAVQVIAVATFASSVPLAVYSAAASARLRLLGATSAGPTIALTGGILAAGSLGLTGLLGWTLSRPEITGDTALVRALYLLTFLVGGPAHLAALGVLIAGIATSGLALGLLPRSVARVGMVIAALSRADDPGAGLAAAGTGLAGGTGCGVGVAAGGGRTAPATPRLPVRAELTTTFALIFPAPFTLTVIAVALCEPDHTRPGGSMRIADVLRGKGGAVVTINPDATVSELLAGLAEHNIGAMVVVGPDGVKGIVSERDVVRQLHAHGASVLSLPVEKIMTSVVSTCTKSDTVDSLTLLMTEHRVRHVPVLEDGKLIGIVSIGDVVKTRMEELETEHEQLQSYITQG